MKLLVIGLAAAAIAAPNVMKPRIARMSTARATHSATLLRNGQVLVVGGMVSNGHYLASAELFVPKENAFRAAAAMPSARGGHTATLLGDGRVLIAGGFDGSSTTLASALVYDPTTNRFSEVGAMSVRRGRHSATLLPDGRVLVAGGANGDVASASTEYFDPRTNRFTPGPRMLEPRNLHTAVVVDANHVLVIGGAADLQHVSSTAELLDLRTNRFTMVGSMAHARRKHAATRLADGTILVTGGSDTRDWQGTLSTVEIYDPKSGTFRDGGSLAQPRFKHSEAEVIMNDGSVLIFGGGEGAEQYQPSTRSSAMVPVLYRWPARYYATATRLPDGRVLLAGGYGTDGQAADQALVFAGETQ